MGAPLLEIGGIEVPLAAALGLEQTYEPIGGSAVRRMMNGAGFKQTHWQKIATSISGDGWIPDGWIPDGLQALDYSAAMTLKCVAPRAVFSAGNAIVLPAARRADAAPFGFAILADGSLRDTPANLAGDTLTLAAVAGAVRYAAHYYPQLTVFADPPRSRFDLAGAVTGWELTAEEA